MESSDDDDSVKSIPRPIYEATSAIDSPRPHLLSSAGHDMEPNKRLKYVVSSPPGSANGSSSCSSGTWPVSATTAAGGHASLTMKLTKVSATSTTATNDAAKPSSTSTPKLDKPDKPKVTKEMIALQRSHNESQVLTGYVSDSSKLKRRKSRAVAAQSFKQTASLSSTLPGEGNPAVAKVALKRSKSIPAPEWIQEPEKKRNFAVVNDGDRDIVGDELSVGDEESNSNSSTRLSQRFRSRSKTVSLSSEERQPRRGNMRSENEDFARKHNAFLDRVINDTQDSVIGQQHQQQAEIETDRGEWGSSSLADTDPNVSLFSDGSESKTQPFGANEGEETEQRLSAIWRAPVRDGWDPFCWKCRECDKVMPCSKCLRSFHTYCVRPASTKFDASWKCPECLLIESAPKRSRRNDVSVDLLSQLLSYALERMKHVRGVCNMRAPQEVLPETYKKYFVNPVDFSTLAERIRQRAFHSADEFLGEVKWMQHNALILDSGDAKVEQASKAVVKVCRQEANEIDTCAECYLNANSSDEWFVKVCTHPHLLLWAKLKGFPYWPAKAMGSGPNAVVNVRFFGKHDRANVPVKDCFLYCAQDPNTQTSRRSARDLAECIREVEVHIEHIKEKIGSFHYAPFKTPYDPLKEQQQLEEMMPGVHDVINRQLEPANKTPLQFLIRKTAGDKLSIVKKTKTTESGNESDQSSSPAKKSLHESPTPPPPLPAVCDPPKAKSSNYEVIPRAGDPLRESRGCTVVLKRKSLESTKPTKAMLELAAKRKHSQSDASSEASSHLGASETSSEHRRRSKHARKQLQEQEAETHSEQETEVASAADPVATEAHSAVVSVVELVRRRQGVTITKIPREQQQQQQQQQQLAAPVAPAVPVATVLPVTAPVAAAIAAPAPANPTPSEATNADEMLARQRAVERQQQQLISKVVPFVEIKREVLSEPEEGDEVPPPAPQEQPQVAVEAPTAKISSDPIPVPVVSIPAPVSVPAPATLPAPPAPPTHHPTGTVPPPVIVPIKIKEEVMSEEEMETEADSQQITMTAGKTQQEEATPATLPMPPPATPIAAASAAAPSPRLNEDIVRFVGDTTIQRLSHKQSPKPAETPTNKRHSMRGVPHGPLPAAAHSPPSAPSSPAPSASPKPANSNRSTPGQTQKSPVPQQVRVKTDKSLSVATSPPPNLLKTNMVVIPIEARNSSAAGGNGGIVGTGMGTVCLGSGNLNNSNLMTIPVPPLRAVSKNTLQAGAMISVPLPMPTPPPAPAFGNSSVPPPPLAGLTGRSNPNPNTPAEPATGNLLANALNGLPSDTLVTESTAGGVEPISAGVATALSEMVLRSGPPKLTARPCGPLHSDGSSIYPAQAGPLSMRLKENAHKITDYFISVIEDTLSDLAGGEPSVLQARIAGLTLENERIKQHYERQLADMQRSTDLMITEMRKTLEQENKRVISELRQHSTLERMRAVEEAKKKQWCANCMREAQLYCCWNTSYCDYPCQQLHWQRHSANCGQAATLPQQQQTQIQQAQVQQTTQAQSQVQPMQTEPMRNKQKTAPSSGQQVNRSPIATTTVQGANKKWTTTQQSMISLMNPQPPSTEVLKLPNNTFLRPVSLPATVVSANSGSGSVNNNNSTSLITPVALPTSHLGNTLLTGRGNNLSYGGSKQNQQQQQVQPHQQPQPQPVPVQRYNIPLPITVSSNASSFGLISEQHQKQLPKQSGGRNNSKSNNSRGRNNPNNSSSNNNSNSNNNNSNNNNGNNSNNIQVMRQNQMYQNQLCQQ